MNRRTLLATALLLPAMAAPVATPGAAWAQQRFQPTAQDRADLARIEAYLNGLRNLKAHFIQIAPDGRLAAGTAWLSRPGRMRFEYFPPNPFLLIAGNGVLVFHDSALKQTTQIFLSQTPLGILLAEQVKLSGDLTVLSLRREPNMLAVQVMRTAHPGEGSLTLVFADQPLALRQWIVIDAQRNETRVTLSDVQMGGSFDSSLFRFQFPDMFNAPNIQGN